MEVDEASAVSGTELAIVVGASASLAVAAAVDGVGSGLAVGGSVAVAKSERQTKAVPWKEKLMQAALTEGDRVLFGKSGKFHQNFHQSCPSLLGRHLN